VDTPGHPLDGALKREFLLHLLLPLALLPLAAPGVLVIALPVVAAHLASVRLQQHTIVFQYTALLTPVLVTAAILGAARIVRWRAFAHRPLLIALALATVASQALFGPFGAGLQRSRAQAVFPSPIQRAMARHHDRLLAAVPARGTVVSGFESLARLAHRPDVHALHHVLSGRYTYSSRPYPLPATAVAILGDLSSPRLMPRVDAGSARRLRALIDRSGLAPAAAAGDLLLLDRDPRTPTLELVGPAPAPAASRTVTFDRQLRWLGARLADPGTGVLELATHWERIAAVDRLFLMEIAVTDARGGVVHRHRRWLGYVVAPPAEWPLGTAMRERYRLVLPEGLARGRHDVRMRVLATPGDPAAVTVSGPDARWITLGRFER
jgi:hypothetical protein